MSLITFNKIKLFKRAEIQPRRTQVEPPPGETKPPPLVQAFKSPVTFLVITVVVTSLLLSYIPSKSLEILSVGEIAPSDIVAPFDLSLEDTEATEKRREMAAEAVLPVYTYEPNVFANTEEKVRRLFSTGRDGLGSAAGPPNTESLRRTFLESLALEIDSSSIQSLVRLKFASEFEETLVSLLAKVFRDGIILSRSLLIHGEEEKGLTLLNSRSGERNIKVTEIRDITESKARFAEEVGKLDIPQRNKSLLLALSEVFVTPNITYNKIETETRIRSARGAVPVLTSTIKKGRMIIRKGDEVDAESVDLIGLFNQRLENRTSWLPGFMGSFLVYLLLFTTLWCYLKSLLESDRVQIHFRMMGTFLVISLALYKFSLFLANTIGGSTSVPSLSQSQVYFHAFPFQAGTLIFAFLTSDQMTLVFAIINSVTVGYLLGGDFNLMIFCFLGGLAAIYGVRYFQKTTRLSILKAGVFLISPVNVLVLLTFHLIESRGGLGIVSTEMIMALLGGALSAAAAFVFLPLVESAFGFITPSKLLELSNSDLPIFRKMSIEAPGSYHHSLIVATVAEKAAEEIGLDAQLVKAGALYHDIGKTKRPEYFLENRSRDSDLHKDLKPSMSTLVIVNHVKEGIEIAKKLKLPRILREMIEQHHGNSLVRYFFNKAKLTYDPEQQKVGEESYRYPGPPPRTKEAALVMLADSVEAASRSLKNPTRDNLRRVITDIFNNYLQDGQLDDCNISLRELRSIASSFLGVIYAIYHPRIDYPGFEFEKQREKKPAKAGNNDDRNHQPPEKAPDQGEDV